MAEAPLPDPAFVSPWASSEAEPAAAPQAVPAPGPSARAELFWGAVSTLLLAGWIALWAGPLGAVALVGGVFVHEFGHLMVINWAGAGPSRIRIIPFFGGAATMSRAPDSEIKGVLIALAGPAFGLVAAAPFFVATVLTGDRSWLAGAFYVGALNLINLAPAAPLDGANALGPALARINPLLERGMILAIAIVGLAWSIGRGSWLFAIVIAFGALRAFATGGLRPASRRLTLVEWLTAVALYALVVAACAGVTLAAAQGGGVAATLMGLSGGGR